jgi:Uncharacterised protein domain (DUF2415)
MGIPKCRVAPDSARPFARLIRKCRVAPDSARLFARLIRKCRVAPDSARVGWQAVARLQAGSACRGVKYSSGPADLLVFSEHENYCHIVDARKYTEAQVRGIYLVVSG